MSAAMRFDEGKVLDKLSNATISAGLLVLLPMLAGCSGGAAYAPVAGRVTEDGKGVEGVRVAFEPVEGEPNQASIGVTDAAGRFQLTSPDGRREGALAGSNRVTLSFGDADVDADEFTALPSKVVPLRFRDGSVLYEVPDSGATSADFSLD